MQLLSLPLGRGSAPDAFAGAARALAEKPDPAGSAPRRTAVQLRSLRWVWASLLLLCGARLEAETPRTLQYAFDLRDTSSPRITLEFRAEPGGQQDVLLPSIWAGQGHLERAVQGLTLLSAGSLAATDDPARYLLRAKPGSQVRLSYELVQDWSGPLNHPLEHRVIAGPELLQFNGENGLVHPALGVQTPVTVRFQFTGLPAGETLVTSFGLGSEQRFRGDWLDVLNALFTAATLRTRTIEVGGKPVLFAVHGTWSFSDEQAAHTVAAILGAERGFWQEAGPPFFAVVLAQYAQGGSGGSGFTNMFNLFLNPGETLGAETERLIAHEAFHAWNPGGLGLLVDSEKLAWFGEGFTDFYAERLLLRAGLLKEADVLERLNRTLREYTLSPERTRTNAALLAADQDDPAVYHQPYLRGELVAIWLDREIRQQRGGRRSLDDVMLALRAGRAEPLTAERVFAAAGRLVDPATAGELRRYALDGATVPFLPGTLGPCVRFVQRQTYTYRLGFRADSLHPNGTITGLEPDGPAARAGLREGDQLAGFSVYAGDAEREAVLRVLRNGTQETVRYHPRGVAVQVPQAEAAGSCAEPAFTF